MAAGVDSLEWTVYTELSLSLDAMENTLQSALHLPTNMPSLEASAEGLFPNFLGVTWAASESPVKSGSDCAKGEGFPPMIAFKLPKRKHVAASETGIGGGGESEEKGKDVQAVQSNLDDERKAAADTRASFDGEAAQLSEALEMERSEGRTLAQQRDAHLKGATFVGRYPWHASVLELLHDELSGTLEELSGEVASLKQAVATVTKRREEERNRGASDAEEVELRRRQELEKQLWAAKAQEAAGGCLSSRLPPGPGKDKKSRGGGGGERERERRARQLSSVLTLDLGLNFTRPSETACNPAHVDPVWV